MWPINGSTSGGAVMPGTTGLPPGGWFGCGSAAGSTLDDGGTITGGGMWIISAPSPEGGACWP